MFISLLEMLHIFCNYGPIITLIWHCLYITLFLLLTPYQNISTSKTCLPYPFYSPSNSSVFKVLVKIQIRNLVFWINEKKNHIETPEGIVSYIHSYKSLEKKKSFTGGNKVLILVNNNVIFNVLCKYCQSLIFLFYW